MDIIFLFKAGLEQKNYIQILSENSQVSVLIASVKHSQRLTTTPIRPWIAAEKNGKILCANCTCMAGLGEACSHISALLFAAEANTQLEKILLVPPPHAHGLYQALRRLIML